MGYRWRDHSEGATLSFNYRGVGSIHKVGDAYRWQISHRGKVHEGVTRNPQRQKVWMTRWLAAKLQGVSADEILRPRSE